METRYPDRFVITSFSLAVEEIEGGRRLHLKQIEPPLHITLHDRRQGVVNEMTTDGTTTAATARFLDPVTSADLTITFSNESGQLHPSIDGLPDCEIEKVTEYCAAAGRQADNVLTLRALQEEQRRGHLAHVTRVTLEAPAPVTP
ncbi:MAG: hypothetical protein H6855_00590 [Rhodospirillales bacterium]|nr:hypothetical protein [Rhodospirillales bacterium]